MNGRIRGRGTRRGLVARDAVAALAQLDALGHERPIVLAYHPVTPLNPYQALLYARAWDHGIAPVGLHRIDELEELREAVVGAAGRPLLHLHWTTSVLWKARSDDEARRAVDAFLDRLDRFIAGRGQIAWTVHNVLPHDARHPQHEATLQQGIVDRATVVHVLAAGTAEAASSWFTIPPDRLLHVPHPAYAGAYLDRVSREQARWELGLDPDEVVYAALGAIKPYKGIERLLDAFDALVARGGPRRRLIVAGTPDAGRAGELLERCALHPFVVLHARTIPSDEMQLFLRAADLAVLPYHRSLNSGVLLLALTFGLPVVAPATGGTRELVAPSFGRLFDPGSDEALLDALAEADVLLTSEAREAARRSVEPFEPDRLADVFARAVRERMDSADGGSP